MFKDFDKYIKTFFKNITCKASARICARSSNEPGKSFSVFGYFSSKYSIMAKLSDTLKPLSTQTGINANGATSFKYLKFIKYF